MKQFHKKKGIATLVWSSEETVWIYRHFEESVMKYLILQNWSIS